MAGTARLADQDPAPEGRHRTLQGRGAAGRTPGRLRPRGGVALRQDRRGAETDRGLADRVSDGCRQRRPHQRGGRRAGRGRGRIALDGHSRDADARLGAREAAPHGGGAAQARGGAGAGHRCDLGRRAPFARRAERPAQADRIVHLPRYDGRGQDRAGEGARRVPLQRRLDADAHRHERISGAPQRVAARGGASGIRRLRRRRPTHRSRTAQALLGGAARRDREGAPRCLQHPVAGARRRSPDRQQGADGGFPQYDHHHDLEHGFAAHSGEFRRRLQRREVARRYGRADTPGGHRPVEAATQARVSEPHRRDRDVRTAHAQGYREDRRHPVGYRAAHVGRERSGTELYAGGAGVDRRSGLRSDVRRTTRQADDPARSRQRPFEADSGGLLFRN